MTTKEILKENYLQYLCELGFGHEETKAAKTLYDNYCIAEHETIARACEWLYEHLTINCKIGDCETIEEFRKAMEE